MPTKCGEARREERGAEGNPGLGQERRGVGADAEEGRLRQRLLPSVADDQIDAHGSNRRHQPQGENVDAVALEPGIGNAERGEIDRHQREGDNNE